MTTSSAVEHRLLGLAGLLLLSGALLCGCPSNGSNVRGPAETVRAYLRAVQQKKYDAAYDMMSEEFRAKHARKAFVEQLKAQAGAGGSIDLAQVKGPPKELRLMARVRYGDADALRLVRSKDGAWRIASDPVHLYSQATPRQALRSFIRAIEARRYDVVLRFVPNEWVESMTIAKLRKQWEGDKQDEVRTLLTNLKANLDAPIREQGDSATMPYGDRFEVRFVREDGVWKIEDPD